MSRIRTVAIFVLAFASIGYVSRQAQSSQEELAVDKAPATDTGTSPQNLSPFEKAMRNTDIKHGRLLPEGRAGVVTIFQSSGGWGIGRVYYAQLYDDGSFRFEGLSKTKVAGEQHRQLDPRVYTALAKHVRNLDNKACTGISDSWSTTYRLLTREEDIEVFKYGCDIGDMDPEILRLLSLEEFVGKGGAVGWLRKEEQ